MIVNHNYGRFYAQLIPSKLNWRKIHAEGCKLWGFLSPFVSYDETAVNVPDNPCKQPPVSIPPCKPSDETSLPNGPFVFTRHDDNCQDIVNHDCQSHWGKKTPRVEIMYKSEACPCYSVKQPHIMLPYIFAQRASSQKFTVC